MEILRAVLGTGPLPPNPVFLLTAVSFSLFLIAAAVEISNWFRGSALFASLLATGRMTLTLYVAHIIVGLGGLSLTGMLTGQTDTTAFLAALGFSVLSVLFCYLWAKKYGTGPLEKILRWLSSPALKNPSRFPRPD